MIAPITWPSPTCRRCGCTDERACRGGCYWVTSDICSRCDVRNPLWRLLLSAVTAELRRILPPRR